MKLFRELSLASAMLLVVGNVIGTGIFTTTGLIAQEVSNPTWLLGVWLAGGILSLLGALCYAQLGAHIPKAGGEFAFLYPYYGPLIAFLSGWTSLIIGFSGPIAAATLGLIVYLTPYLPLSLNALDPRMLATIILLLVTGLVSIGLSFSVRLHSVVTILNVVLLASFSYIILSYRRHAGVLSELSHARSWTMEDLAPTASALVLVLFSYSGWNAAIYIAEEIRNPARNLPRSLILGTGLVTILYLAVNLAYLSALPLSLLKGEIAVAQAVTAAVLPSGTWLMTLLILVSILSSITAMSIAGPRVYFAMSRSHLFPSWLGKVDVKRKIPLMAIWFQSSVALTILWLSTLRQILLFSGFALVLFSTLAVSVLLRIPLKSDINLTNWSIHRLLPWTFVLTNTLILISVALSHPMETLSGLGMVAAGLPMYLFYRKHLSANT